MPKSEERTAFERAVTETAAALLAAHVARRGFDGDGMDRAVERSADWAIALVEKVYDKLAKDSVGGDATVGTCRHRLAEVFARPDCAEVAQLKSG